MSTTENEGLLIVGARQSNRNWSVENFEENLLAVVCMPVLHSRP